MNNLSSAKDIALSPFCYMELHLFVMDEHVFVMSKHLTDKQQQLFDKQKHLSDSKQYLATSSMKDGQEAKEDIIYKGKQKALPCFETQKGEMSGMLLALGRLLVCCVHR